MDTEQSSKLPTDAATKIKRKTISKRIRFEVFKRDSFKCQYCGSGSPDVILEIDHIHPVAKGGRQTDIVNLITACQGCNAGKSDKLLSDDAIAKKRKHQLDALQERREQLEMMAEWQLGLVDLTEASVQHCSELWSQVAMGYHLTEQGIQTMRGYVVKFGQADVMDAMRKAARYFRTENGKFTSDSVCLAFTKVGGICVIERRAKEDPDLHEVYRIRAMLKGRIETLDDRKFMISVKRLRDAGISVSEIRRSMEPVQRWWQFDDAVDAMLRDQE